MKTCSLLLHFLRLQIQTHSHRLYGWLNAYYKSYDQCALFPLLISQFDIEIEELGSPHELEFKSERRGVFTRFCLANSHCFYENGVFYSCADGQFAHQIEIDLVHRTMRANVGAEFLQSEESFIYNLVRDVLGKLILPCNRLMMMHGAVVTDGARTIFLAGRKGMGKSTIALKMMENGYAILSDDSPLFTFVDGQTVVLSSLDELSVTDNTLRLFPKLGQFVSRQREVSGKFFLSRDKLEQSKLASGPLAITDFVQLRRGAYDQARLLPDNKTQVAAELLREFMSVFHADIALPSDSAYFKEVNRFIFDTTSSLLCGARVYTLEYNDRHLDQIADLLAVLEDARRA